MYFGSVWGGGIKEGRMTVTLTLTAEIEAGFSSLEREPGV